MAVLISSRPVSALESSRGLSGFRQRRTIVAAVVRLAMKLIGVGVALILMAPAAWGHDEPSAFHVTITYPIKVYSFDVVSAPELP